MLRHKYFSSMVVTIASFLICSCSQVKTDVFAVQNAELLSPFENHGADESTSFGPKGSRTISIRVHRLAESHDGWVIGVRRNVRDAWAGSSQNQVMKLTMYFPERPDGEYLLSPSNDKVRVIYSGIDPAYVAGCAADASFGTLYVEWESETKFVVHVHAAFDTKYDSLCTPAAINEMFQGEMISFDELTPWLGAPNELDSFEGMHQELRRD